MYAGLSLIEIATHTKGYTMTRTEEVTTITLEKLTEIAPNTLLLKLARVTIQETGKPYTCIYSGSKLMVVA